MWKIIRQDNWLIVLVLATLPIQQFWIRPLVGLGAPDWLTFALTNWAAPVIFFLAAVGFWRSRPRITADYWLLIFTALALMPIIWQFAEARELAVGWRYTLFATLGYWIGRGRLLSSEVIDRCLRVTLWAVLAGIGLQLIFWLAGSDELISKFGFEPAFAAGDWWRVFGPMSGPNQLGTFLALAGAWLFWRKRLTRIELILVLVGVILTFSRSAFLGLAAGLLIAPIVLATTWRQRLYLVAGVLAATVVVALAITNTASLREGLIEARRADLRITLLHDTAERFRSSAPIEWVIGHGAGTAGPAAAVLQNGGFIPENWFLQVAYEFGVLGLVSILLLLVAVTCAAIKQRHRALLGIVLVMVVNSLFLHPLSDNFAAALWFYFMLGAAITPSKPEENKVQ